MATILATVTGTGGMESIPDTYIFPVSYQQKRLWLVDQLDPESAAYNMPFNLRLVGDLNFVSLRCSWSEIARRHEILRTTFCVRDGAPMQEIHPARPLRLPVIDLSGLKAWTREEVAREIRQAERERPFNLAQGPLIRVSLVRLGEREHELLVLIHHIVNDGWSEGVILRELGTLYRAYCSGQSSTLPELEIQYADYALWQQEWLQGPVLETHLQYWRRKLADLPILELPKDYPRSQNLRQRGEMLHFRFEKELSAKLRELGRTERVTLFAVLLAGFQLLLSKYTSQRDFGIGTVTANRNRKETEGLIGFFVNTLVLRADLSGNPTFREFLQRVHSVTIEAYEHQDVPFEKLVEELNPERNMARTPLIQVGLGFQNLPDSEVDLGPLQILTTKTVYKYSFIDLGISLQEGPESLAGALIYSTELFARDRMERLLRHFEHVFTNIVNDHERHIRDITLLTDDEMQQLVVEWNRTDKKYAREQLVHEMFEEQAHRCPEAIAIVCDGMSINYGDLNGRANRLAHYLHSLQVGPESRVGICVDRDPQMVVAVLGVLKTGAAYVPLDPLHPASRLNFVLRDSHVSVLLTSSKWLEKFVGRQETIICLDNCSQIELQSSLDPSRHGSSENLAYIIYTSGSTGTPKGVMLVHAGLINVIRSSIEILNVTPQSRISQLASLTFDASVAEIFIPLCAGASLCIIGPAKLLSPNDFVGTLRGEAVSIMGCVPSVLGLLSPEMIPTVHTMIVGGESCPLSTATPWLDKRRFLNAYAPTEATIFSNLSECRAAECESALTLGPPINNARLYVVNEDMNPVPVGVTGEIYIGGVGVARGYWGLPGLTAQQFVPNPFSEEPGSRLYKTGDLAKFQRNGRLEFIGRIDDQIKLRGYRIELGEIEAVLNRLQAIENAVVIVREDKPEDKRLVAYLVSRGDKLGEPEVRQYLRTQLPEYMVPSAFVQLNELPLTENGKVDRRALPPPPMGNEDSFTPPRTAQEDILAGIWMDVLGLERIGVDDNFFDLGGHSVLATRVVAQAERMGIRIPLRALFEAPTVALLAERIARLQASDEALLPPPLQRRPFADGIVPLSFSQLRLWLLNQLEPANRAYNVPIVLRIKGPLHIDTFRVTLDEIVRRHEVLRASFPAVEGEPRQVVSNTARASFHYLDLTSLPPDAAELRSRELADIEIRRSFDLAKGPLFRVAAYALGKHDHLLCFTVHHMVSDARSLRILIHEMRTLYQAFLRRDPSPLPELPLQFADVAVWERNWLRDEVLNYHVNYWRRRLEGCVQQLNLPADFPRPLMPSFRGATDALQLALPVARDLQRLGRTVGVTDFMTLLAVIDVWLFYYTGQTDILIGSPVSNRHQVQTESLIGFFINTVVFRNQVDPEAPFTAFLKQVRANALDAYAHQALPFERIVDELKVVRHSNTHPVFQVFFHFENSPDAKLEFAELDVEIVETNFVQSQFDLLLGAHSSTQGIEMFCTYSSDLFRPSTIASMLSAFGRLAELVRENPESPIRELVSKLADFDLEQKVSRKQEMIQRQGEVLTDVRRRRSARLAGEFL